MNIQAIYKHKYKAGIILIILITLFIFSNNDRNTSEYAFSSAKFWKGMKLLIASLKLSGIV